MKIGAALLLLLLSLCFAAIVAVKIIVDESWLQQKIVDALGGQRAVEVGSSQLYLLPPAVELRQVLIGSPEAFSDGKFIKLDRARLELDVLSLLAGPLVVEITVSDFSMHLVRDQVEQFYIDIDIDNLSITWHDLESNKTVSFNDGEVGFSGLELNADIDSPYLVNGQASINIGEGKVLGIDIVQKLHQIADANIFQLWGLWRREKLGAGYSSSDSTEFTSLTATVTVADGLARNEDLVILSPLFEVNGNGQYDLSKNDINYTLELGFKSGPYALLDKLAGVQFPINIKGALPKPCYSFDVSQIPMEFFAKSLLKFIDWWLTC